MAVCVLGGGGDAHHKQRSLTRGDLNGLLSGRCPFPLTVLHSVVKVAGLPADVQGFQGENCLRTNALDVLGS